MLGCAEVEPLLGALLDGELETERQLELERHLESCSACAACQRAALELRERLRGAAPYFPAPPALTARIRAAMEPPRRFRILHWGWVPAAAAALMLVLLLPRLAARPDAEMAQQVEADHVRSLLANHLMDVASTDQHTVKPWFHGRLDYAPPVEDYAAQGFPLIGGRLDYLDQRNVAALVYRHKLHPINVFVWPATGTSGQSERQRDGYTILHWVRNGMTWWIISDVDEVSLKEFAGLLQGKQ